MKTDLLWNRFLCYWLPADEVQDGDIEANIDRAFNRTYTQVNGKNAGFSSIRGGGSAIITATETVVATKGREQDRSDSGRIGVRQPVLDCVGVRA